MNRFILIVTALLFAGNALAATAGKGYVTLEYPWVMRSPVALGMGNAYYTKSDSKYAPFYNPAGLNRINNWYVDILPVGSSINNNIFDFAKDLEDADLDNNSELAKNLLIKHMGKMQFASASFYPGYTRHNFTVGIFGNAQLNAQPANPILPELNVDTKMDYGLVVGLAGAFLNEKLQIGLAGRYQSRYSFKRSYTFHDLATDVIKKDFENPDLDIFDSGHGFLADVGVIYNFYKEGFNPRIGAAVNNMGANSFGPAEDLPYSVALSFGISPNYGVFKSDIILDVIDVTRNFEQDEDWGKRLNLGAEVNFDIFLLRRFAFRAGLHQGYFTYGFGFDFTVVRFNYAYYKEEVGAYAGQDEDTRHVAELVLGF